MAQTRASPGHALTAAAPIDTVSDRAVSSGVVDTSADPVRCRGRPDRRAARSGREAHRRGADPRDASPGPALLALHRPGGWDGRDLHDRPADAQRGRERRGCALQARRDRRGGRHAPGALVPRSHGMGTQARDRQRRRRQHRQSPHRAAPAGAAAHEHDALDALGVRDHRGAPRRGGGRLPVARRAVHDGLHAQHVRRAGRWRLWPGGHDAVQAARQAHPRGARAGGARDGRARRVAGERRAIRARRQRACGRRASGRVPAQGGDPAGVQARPVAAAAEGILGLSAHVQRAVWCFEHDLVATASVFTGGAWDSHTRNAQNQTRLTPYLVAILDRLFGELDRRSNAHGPLSEQTAVVVASELGRFPYLNQAQGKDHYPQTSMLFYGKPFRAGKFGDTGKQLEGLPVSVSTGRAGGGSPEPLRLDDVGATALLLAGIDPEKYGFTGRRLDFLVEA
ncbi:MAG: DUF1501 domain-containing protein [Deltaproteobacteria bacterium]|nr:MAG: DUF1501 domain-containing protein [Deltaproteobacteria bacterium]